MKVALAVVSFLLAAASWAGLFVLFFAVFGKENYVATTATYGVLPILFLTKVLYDSVSPPQSVQRAGTLAKGAVSLFLASTIWAVVFLFVYTWPSSLYVRWRLPSAFCRYSPVTGLLLGQAHLRRTQKGCARGGGR